MGDVQTQPSAVVIAFPAADRRKARSGSPDGEPRGAILLFTGVRYDRLGPTPGPSQASDGQARRRRRR